MPEDVPGLLDAMTPKQREAFEAAQAPDAGEAEVVAEIDADDPPDPDPDIQVYVA